MKITEISFIPKSEQKRALFYSEHSSQARSLHLIFQHESAAQQQFLLEAFKEIVKSYLSPSDLLSPRTFVPYLIERFESFQEDGGLALDELQGMGLFLLLQTGRSVFLLTSQEDQVQIRFGEQVYNLHSADDARVVRMDAFDAPPQEELFPTRLRDTLTLFKISATADAPLEVVMPCRDDELPEILTAIRDAGSQKGSESKEVPLDVLSKRSIYILFEGYPTSPIPAGKEDTKEISLRAPFGRVHNAAIVITAVVVFIAGAAWITGKSPKPTSDKPPDLNAQQARVPGVEPSADAIPQAQEPGKSQEIVDLASTRLHLGWSEKFEQGVTSSPIASGTKVIFGCRDGKMRALNILTGAAMWGYEAAGGIGASPAIHGDKVIGADYTGAVFALELETGNRIWSSKLPGRVVSSPCILGDRVVVGCFDNFVYCLSALDGRVLWNATTNGRVWATAAASEETFFIPSYDGNLYALSSGTGEIKWTYKVGGEVICSPALVGGNVIVGAADGRLHAINCTTGEAAWIFDAGAAVNSAISTAAGRVFFGSKDAHLYCVDGQAGTMIWRCKTDGYILGRPCTAGGYVFTGSYGKTMYCVNAKTGAIIDRFQTSGKIYSSPAVLNKKLFFGNNDGEFFCLNYANERTS
jgi:outer membrane protein assembly factor BamB